MKQSKIILRNLQVKSTKKALILVKCLEMIEEECGIEEVEITVNNIFWCPWIDNDIISKSSPMGELIIGMVDKLEGGIK